ncbi:MAG: FKBP-type peptidyl-prolyl cis-trans isomerase [Candidatus Paceibacteria bacterium]|jgi:FKBP-type peptidyl-prolyl cis-trans isomerase
MKKTGVIISFLIVIGLIVMAVFSPSNESSGVNSNNTNNNMETDNQSGLIIEVLGEGSGEESKIGNTVYMHYTGTLLDGTVFDSSIGKDPFPFTLGENRVIAGWEQGVLGMKTGEKRRLTIPAALAYGDRGAGNLIGPGETLVFEVELLEIK